MISYKIDRWTLKLVEEYWKVPLLKYLLFTEINNNYFGVESPDRLYLENIVG